MVGVHRISLKENDCIARKKEGLRRNGRERKEKERRKREREREKERERADGETGKRVGKEINGRRQVAEGQRSIKENERAEVTRDHKLN